MSNREVKSKLRELARNISGAKDPLIMIYGNPDPDALGAAWAA